MKHANDYLNTARELYREIVRRCDRSLGMPSDLGERLAEIAYLRGLALHYAPRCQVNPEGAKTVVRSGCLFEREIARILDGSHPVHS